MSEVCIIILTAYSSVFLSTLLGCSDGVLRLVGGVRDSEGRVEICFNSTWGTVCDDFWGVQEASVVCRQLGYSPTGAVATVRAFFGQGMGPIFLDDVSCSGSELRLVNCPANPVGQHNCVHFEDAGVRCQAIVTPPPGEFQCSKSDDSLSQVNCTT